MVKRLTAIVCCLKALLHAISKRLLDIVRIIVDHPKYSSEETRLEREKTDAAVYAQQKYQYSPDITPLMLAAHMYAVVLHIFFY